MATSLRNRLQATALAAMACILFSPFASRAEVTYRLVTSDDQILDRCVYIMAADLPDNSTHAVGKFEVKPTDAAIKQIPTTIIKDVDNQIALTDGLEEFSFRYAKSKAPKSGYDWNIKSITSSSGTSYTFYSYSKILRIYPLLSGVKNGDESKTEPLYENSKVILNSDNTVSITTFSVNENRPWIWGFVYDKNSYILNAFDPNAVEGTRPKLYRKDVYNLSVLEIKKLETGDYNIKVHVNQFDASDPYAEGMLFYGFSDNEFLTNNDIYSLSGKNGKKLSSYNSGDLEINYNGSEKFLWLIREHGANEYQTDAIRIEIKETPAQLPVTSIEAGHFAVPKTEGYSAGQQIEFERQNDVKIYYTLDDNDPVIPSANSMQALDESEDHSGKTYDLDERPLTYDGSPLSVRFVAIKSGYAPSEVHSFSVAGTTTSLETIKRDDDSQAEYFTLQGVRLTAAPSAPGIYLRKSASGKVQKIIIR